MGLKLTLQEEPSQNRFFFKNICVTKLHQNLTLSINCLQFKDFLTLGKYLTYFPNNLAFFEGLDPSRSPFKTTKPSISPCHPRKKTLTKHKKILPNLSTLLPSPFGKRKKKRGENHPLPIHPS
jgi:hypothetical protein